MKPPTWAKNATPPPFAEALNSPKFGLDELVQEPQAEEDPGRDLDEEHGEDVRTDCRSPCPCAAARWRPGPSWRPRRCRRSRCTASWACCRSRLLLGLRSRRMIPPGSGLPLTERSTPQPPAGKSDNGSGVIGSRCGAPPAPMRARAPQTVRDHCSFLLTERTVVIRAGIGTRRRREPRRAVPPLSVTLFHPPIPRV